MPEIVQSAVRYVAAGGGEFLIHFIFLFFLYVTIRYVITRKQVAHQTENGRRANKQLLHSSLLLIGILMSALLILGVFVEAVNNSPAPIEVIKTSQALMQFEHDLFGVYPAIWLHDNANYVNKYLDVASPLIVESYAQLGLLISLLLLFALVHSPHVLFRISIAFALSVFASIPFWIAFPAVTPNEAFFSNKLHAEIPSQIQAEMKSFSPNPFMDGVLRNIANNRKTGENGYYGITTIPSMHITWAVFVLYYGTLLYRGFALYLVPYFIVNAFSTIYLLQHFTLDVVTGIMMGVLLVYVVEKGKGKTPAMLLTVGSSMKSDFHYGVMSLSRVFSRVGGGR